MKMPLMEVDLSPGHIVLDGGQLPIERGTAAPLLFSANVYFTEFTDASMPSQTILA